MIPPSNSATKARDMHHDYRSASCDDVARMVDKLMIAEAELTSLREYKQKCEEQEKLTESYVQGIGVEQMRIDHMKKFMIKTKSTFENVYLVEASSSDIAERVVANAQLPIDFVQKHLEEKIVSITEVREERDLVQELRLAGYF